MIMCPRGCDAEMEYCGVGDGYGLYGMDCCDVYVCPACGEEQTGHCIECDGFDQQTANHSPETGKDERDE